MAEFTQEHYNAKGAKPIQGFAVCVEGRGAHPSLRSFHPTEQSAQQALRKTIDMNALVVNQAEVTLARNGNIRLWRSKR